MADEQNMNPLLRELLTALARWALTAAIAFLLGHGLLDATLAGRVQDYLLSPVVLTGIVALLGTGLMVARAWIHSRRKFLTALALPAESTADQVRAAIADPTIETPPLSKAANAPSYLKRRP
jgi:hypothetical protein